MDELEFDRLVEILRMDYAFVYGADRLSWTDGVGDRNVRVVVVENDRQ